jgi:ribosomal protein S25
MLALDLLTHYPVVTAKRLSDLLGVSIPQATQAVRQLEESGILSERTGHRRNRIFAAEEALAIINRPFGEPPILPGQK